jgi:hypothetical protein
VATNLPAAPLRWNLIRASHEWGYTDDTLKKWLVQAKISPGEDSCYSTQELTTAIYGSKHLETIRKIREEADKIALDNAITRGEVLYREPLEKGASALTNALTVIVLSSSMTRQEQDDFLLTISGLSSTIQDVAKRQKKKAKKG